MNKIDIYYFYSSFVYLLFFLALFFIYNGDLSQFVQFSNLTDTTKIPFIINPIDNTGYDGQFYIRLALNPFDVNWEHSELPETNPSYRFSRIGYPIILWSLSFFIQSKIVLIAQLLNLVSIFLIYFVNKKILLHFNKKNNLAFLFLFFPGFLFCIARCTPEIVEILFISISFLLYLRKSFSLYLFFIVFALLIRETSLIFLIGLFIYQFFNNFKNIKYSVIPIVFYFLWTFFLFLIFNDIPVTTGVSVNFDFPFFGLIEIFNLSRYSYNILQGFTYLTEFTFLFFIIYLSLKPKILEYKNLLSIILSLYLLYFFCLNEIVLGTDWGFMRILLELYYFLTLFIIINLNFLKRYIFVFLAFFGFCYLRILIEQYLKYQS